MFVFCKKVLRMKQSSPDEWVTPISCGTHATSYHHELCASLSTLQETAAEHEKGSQVCT